MPEAKKLTALRVEKATKPGMYSDGDGLYLRVHQHGGKSWSFRFARKGVCKMGVDGKPVGREMGLGPYPEVTLANARIAANEARMQLIKGIDPIKHRDKAREERALAITKGVTFDWCAEEYIKAHKAGWRNEKHAAQWSATIKAYASPVFGNRAISEIENTHVLKAINAIWIDKTETAMRLRGRIEAVFDWAMAHDHREKGPNPAAWKGNLKVMLPDPKDVREVIHHAALGYNDIPNFVDELMTMPGEASRGLLFAILTAARTGEVRFATWQEIDLAKREWRIPASRMKAKKEHRVPLSDAAIAVLTQTLSIRKSEDIEHSDQHYIFGQPGKPLSNNAFLALLHRMNRTVTAHGMRSTFKDWCVETTNYPNAVSEVCLAHIDKNKVRAAYQRTDFFELRRSLMAEWATFATTPRPIKQPEKVVAIGKRKKVA